MGSGFFSEEIRRSSTEFEGDDDFHTTGMVCSIGEGTVEGICVGVGVD